VIVWLDDLRDPKNYLDPEVLTNTVWVKSVPEFKEFMRTNFTLVSVVSFDNDLGLTAPGTEGRDAFAWMEERAHLDGWGPYELRIHSANTPARDSMTLGIQSLYRFWGR
jgi:hypothetical protein